MSSSAAYVRDGAVRAHRPFSPIGAVWACVDVVVAFFRTMMEPGYEAVYVGRATTTTTTTTTTSAAGRVRTNGGGTSAGVRGYSNVRTIDHSARAVGG